MVNTGDLPLNLIVVLHAQLAQQGGGAHLNAMAQADGLYAGIALERAGEHRHGVNIIKEPRVGADFLHIVGEVKHHGRGTQGTEYAADAEGIGDGLAQAILFRYFEVSHGTGLIAADLNSVYNIVASLSAALRFSTPR